MSRKYTHEEEVQMWLYVAKCLRDGDPLARDIKGLRFWSMYKFSGHSTRSVQSLNSQFRKHMFDRLHEFELPGKDMLYLYKQLEIPLNPMQKVKFEKKFNCTIFLRDRNHTISEYSFTDLKKAKGSALKDRRSQTKAREVITLSSSEDDEGLANGNSFNLTEQFHDAPKIHADNGETKIRSVVDEWRLEEAREKVCVQLASDIGDIDIARIIEDEAYKVSQNKNTYTEHIRSAISVFPTCTELSPSGPAPALANVADRFKCAVVLKDPIIAMDWHDSISDRSRQEIASKVWNESKDNELWDRFAKYIFCDFQSAEQKAFSFSKNENTYRASLRTKLQNILDEYHDN